MGAGAGGGGPGGATGGIIGGGLDNVVCSLESREFIGKEAG
jgi:hypothetical protein